MKSVSSTNRCGDCDHWLYEHHRQDVPGVPTPSACWFVVRTDESGQRIACGCPRFVELRSGCCERPPAANAPLDCVICHKPFDLGEPVYSVYMGMSDGLPSLGFVHGRCKAVR